MEINQCPECDSAELRVFEQRGQIVCLACGARLEMAVEKNGPLRIFLSYGHDKYAAVAERIKVDLEARGHQVWFDRERLKEGGDWEKYIEEGLNFVSSSPETGRVIFLMTPHSVRRPDGYCLNEIAKAISLSLTVVPVMLVYSEPPLSIYRLQYLDMRHCLPLAEKEENYSLSFEKLVLALEERKLDFEGLQSRFLKTLQPISFSADISRLLRDFTGRKWVFSAVDNWLADPLGSRLFWLTGAPGVGKSAISAWLRDHYRQIAAFHFCDIYSEEKRDPCKLVRSLAYQLSTQLPDYEERLGNLSLGEIVQEYHEAYTLFDKLIVQPLADNFPEPDRTLVLLIDALDEATWNQHNEIAQLLARCVGKIPPWLRFFVTSRPEPEITIPFQAFDPFVLDTATAENLDDLSCFIRQCHPEIDSAALQTLIDRSEGVFLYLRYVSEEIYAGNMSLDHPDEFPRGLGEIYASFFERQFGSDLEFYRNTIRPLLCVVLASFESLNLKMLRQLLGYPNLMVLNDHLNKIGSLLARKGDGEYETISPFHRSLSDWLGDKNRSGHWYIDVDYGHQLFTDYGWSAYRNNPEKLDEYSLTWLPRHLASNGEWQKLKEFLADFLLSMHRAKRVDIEYLLRDWFDTVKEMPKDGSADWQIMESFYRSSSHILRRGNETWPAYKILFQLAIEHADDSPLTVGAEQYLHDGNCTWKWLRRCIRLKSAKVGQRLAVFEGHTDRITGVQILSDGRILSWSDDSTLRIWGEDGTPLAELKGHSGGINGVQILSDGRILSWSRGKTLRIWGEDGTPLAELKGHSGGINGVQILSDGRILSWSKDSTLRIWGEDGTPLARLKGHSGGINGVQILSDGRILSWPRRKILRIWGEDGTPLAKLKGHSGGINGVQILSDGRILSWSMDKTLRIWGEDGTPVAELKGHTDGITGVQILFDGRILSWSMDKTLRIWGEDGTPLAKLKGHTSKITGAQILFDGRILSWSMDKTLRIWGEDGTPLAKLKGHSGGINGVQILSDGRILSWSDDSTLRIWGEGGTPLAKLKGHTDGITGVQILFDGRILSWSKDSTLRIWGEGGTPLAKLKGHTSKIAGAQILSDGRILSWSRDETLRIWAVKGTPVAELKGHAGGINGVQILLDGRILSWAKNLWIWGMDGGPVVKFEGDNRWGGMMPQIFSDGRILLRSKDYILQICAEDGTSLAELVGHTGSISGIRIFPDGRILSWSDDSTLRIWGENGTPLAKLKGHTRRITGVQISSDGRILSWSKDGTLRIWGEDGTPLAKLKGHTDGITGVQILFDGRILSWSDDSTLRIWGEDGTPLAKLKGHTSKITGAQILSDGRILSWSRDKTLRIWGEDGTPLAELKGHTDRIIRGVHILTDGRILSWSKEKILRIWGEDGTPLAELKGHTDRIRGVHILTDGRILSWTHKNTLRTWMVDGQPISVYTPSTFFDAEPLIWKTFFGNECVSGNLGLHGFSGNYVVLGGEISPIHWHGDVNCKAHYLFADGRAVVTLANGQVCLLTTWSGDQRVTLAELKNQT